MDFFSKQIEDMNNISGVRSCYGCGVCGLACGQKIIEIRLNREGFYEPYIADETCCTDCGICTDVCAYLHEDLSSKDHIVLQSYAAWSKDVQIRHKCSSGGVGFELGRYLLGKGYQVCGVRYNPDLNRAEHYRRTYPFCGKQIHSKFYAGWFSSDKPER